MNESHNKFYTRFVTTSDLESYGNMRQTTGIGNMSILPHPSIICLIALECSMLGNACMQRS
jgi:hypothetical protein